MKRQRSVGTRAIAAATLFTFVITSCGGGGKKTPAPPAPSPLSDRVLVQQKDLPPGLDLRVSEGKQGPAAADRRAFAPAKKIGEADAQQLLTRARPIAADPNDQQSFALRPGSQPPPRTGQTIKGQFPPPPSSLLPPASNDAGKDLRVLRYMPEGQVPYAPELSVTFSQPMIAVTSQDDAAKTVPVLLTPTPKGNWRWIGTRTVLFDPDVRFPQATTYTVEVPAGTKSANGGVLKTATKFTFETPAPQLISHYPSGPHQRLDVPMFVVFDQKIDALAAFKSFKVTADGKPVAIELLDAAAVAADKELKLRAEAAAKAEHDGRWIAFRATDPFPKNAAIEIEIAAGMPSAEGPNTTKSAQRYAFRTYPPLRIDDAQCGWGGECRPGMPFRIEFNTPLDEDKFDEAQLSISPPIDNVKIVASYGVISVQGLTKARTTYKVVVSGGVTDAFGQTLGKDTTLTFSVGDAQPTFFGPNGMVVLDPAAKKPTLDFFTTNYEQLKVSLWKVSPLDYDAYGFYLRNQWNRDKPPKLPGKKVFDQLVKTAVGKNELVETQVDLQTALSKDGLGHVIALVEPYPWTEDWDPPKLVAWVQSTRLGVDAHVDAGELVAMATDLATGKAASNVSIEMRPFGTKATTDDKGVATLALSSTTIKGAHFLLARKGDDVAFVSDDGGWWNETGSWFKQARPTQLAWYVIDDRKMYKPGEEVTLKGWLRTLDPGEGGDLGGIGGAVASVAYTVTDSTGNKIATGSAPVSAVGGFDTKFTIPKTPNLGGAYVRFEAKGRMSGGHTHGFEIEEFRRPEFEVSAQASQGPFLVGGGGDVTVNAKYYSGGPLPGAPVNWFVTANPASFSPPNRDEFIFGFWEPWWGYHRWDDDEGGGRYKAPKTWSLAGTTDATGAHTLHLDYLSINPPRAYSVVANATVTDVNRQAWSSSAAMIVHASSLYVGLKTKRMYVDKGTPFDLEVIGVDLDGKAAPGTAIEVKAVRQDWEYKKGKYAVVEKDPQTCSVVAAADPVPCRFNTPVGGSYQVTAVIVDAKGRPNTTKLTFWVSGGDTPPAREVKQEQANLIPDKKEYAAGDTAELMLQAPFYPAEALVSWRRSGIVKVERIALTGPTTTIKVPITDAMVPNMYVQVDLVGAAARTDDKGQPDPKLPKRPAYAVGTINLPVPPKQRTLKVTVAPNVPKLAPGESAKLTLNVTDAQGRPVANSESAVIVVDEAILSLTGYQFPNPVDVFYGQRGDDARDHYSRAYVKLARPDAGNLQANAAPGRARATGSAPMDDAMPAPEAAAMGGMAPPPPPAPPKMNKNREEKESDGDGKADGADKNPAIAIRSNFNPLAAFSPVVKTDAQGRATVDIKVPDNLTRYRIVAIATAGDKQFGKGESSLTARLPLMVRPSPPRFLNFGDTFQLPVVVQNQTDAPMTVKVAVRATNAKITDGAGREVSVPANERVEVLFPAAAEMAGTARFQIVGAAGSVSDASELALPVWTPATTEAFATYGVIDDGAIKQPVALPGQVVPQFGGLEVTTASTNLQALTDALLYLVHYPYECSEQRASRVMAIAALRDVLTAFKTKDMPSPQALATSMATDIERLAQLQNWDGGFAFWERGRPSEPYLSVYVANALAHAQAKGYAVPKTVFDRAKTYLRDIEKKYPWYYSQEVRWAISAYALYTRKAIGDLDLAKGQKLYAEYGGTANAKVSMETHGWLLGLFAQHKAADKERAAIVRHATNRVSETAGAANFVTSYGDGNYLLLSSNRRVDAVMLESLIAEQPQNDLIPKVVTGLLAHRKAGRWLNTQENTFALLALDRYFQTYEKVTPDFVARVWLGNDYAGDHAFKGRTTDYHQIDIPMKDVAAHDKQPLTIQKDGKGRLYYRIGMKYAPASLKLDAADYGFVVQRRYEAVDDPKDVTRDAAGVWHVKAGAKVRVKLTMVNENRRYHVALVDPLPAGLEAMNPALAVTGPIPQDPNEQKSKGAYWWWYGPWYDHQNLRDERTEAFAPLVWEGVHEYSYVARATTPGNFVVPPTKAEEMYMPETFGRSASDRMIVE
ncbi:MAG: Ig-like domain-containing protein [Myxococcales bacterium]|nr:Ig-like domain-containing protein [Myxococcales bacterium]